MIKAWRPAVLFCGILLLVAQPAAASDLFAAVEPIRYRISAASVPLSSPFMQVVSTAPDTNDSENSYRKKRQFFAPHTFLSKQTEPLGGMELVWALVLIALATLISEDLACISAGLMAARGTIGLLPAVVASFVGILLGDILLYLAGRFIGQPALDRAPLKWVIKEEDAAKAARWFSAKGPAIIITSRFLPGCRLPTYFSAGMLGTGFWRFTIYFSVAAVLWTPLLVGLSSLVGNRMFVYYDTFKSYGIMIVMATVLLIWMSVKLIVPLFSYRGRRQLLSFYRRLTR
jgi:membrane protein DedA with SNARE-associated domain